MSSQTAPRYVAAWETLCLESAWYCRVCGAIPEVGRLFEQCLCENCRDSLSKEDLSNLE